MIKQIKTEKFEGLAVLMPDGSTHPELKYYKYSDGKEYHSLNYRFGNNSSYTHGGFLLWYKDFGGRKNYPQEGELKIIGKATELTEAQCEEIVKFVGLPWCAYKDYTNDSNWFSSAKESLSSLMQSLECYSVNPLDGLFRPYLPKEGTTDLGGIITDVIYNDVRELWRKAEEQTGAWLIINKL